MGQVARAIDHGLVQNHVTMRELLRCHARLAPAPGRRPKRVAFRLDAAYPGLRLGLEYLGFDTHRTRSAFAAEIGSAHLVDVERHQIHGRIMMRTVPTVTVQEAVHDMLSVRILEVGGDDCGEFGTYRIAHDKILE